MAASQTNISSSGAATAINANSSFWDRLGAWYTDNKVVAWTIAGVTVVAAGGTIYYISSSSPKPHDSAQKPKKRKSKKKDVEKGTDTTASAGASATATTTTSAKSAVVEEASELQEITEDAVAQMSEQERKDTAQRLKAAGNKAYGSKDYNRAIDLYTQALLCKSDPVFYSNRAACWNALGDWEKVIEDTTAALNLDSEYVKALNRRAHAYEETGKHSEALLDYTASCIIDQFRSDSSAQAVERLLKTVAEIKATDMLTGKEKRLPSPTFVSNYLQSFRAKALPEGLTASAELEEGTGLWHLRHGLRAIQTRTAESYDNAFKSFNKAIELNNLDSHEALAYNMRGTFRYLIGDSEEALQDLNKSIELNPTYVQSYVKRASMHLEKGNRGEAQHDFEVALEKNAEDPDIYYHRAQLHFITTEFSAAAADYQKSIDLDPKFIFSHIQLGVTQYKMGSIASSMATFRRCIKNFGDKSDVYNYYGELLLDQQKYQEAVEKFDTAVEMESKGIGERGGGINVLPLINKALALFQWRQDYVAAEELCQKALVIDPECDIAVATMAQLLLQQGKVTEALTYFERAAMLSRTLGEVVNALSYAEATRTQLEVQQKYPQLASRLQGMGAGMGAPPPR